MSAIDVSIVIVSWNVRTHLARCLASLPAALGDMYGAEMIVVDNASDDGSATFVRQYFTHVQVIALSHNWLYTAAANEGLLRARGRHLLLLNPDTLLHPRSVARLIRYADTHPRAGLLGPRILDANGQDDLRTGRYPPSAGSELADWSGLSRRFPHHPYFAANLRSSFDRRQTASVPVLSGACLLFSSHLPPALRCLNPDFPMYGEDVDLCRRVQQAGFATVLVGDAVITHVGGQSSRQQSTLAAVLAVDAAQRYLRLWVGPRAARLHRLGMGVIALIKLLIYRLPIISASRAAAQRRTYQAIWAWARQGHIPETLTPSRCQVAEIHQRQDAETGRK